jgi:aminopeptidase N
MRLLSQKLYETYPFIENDVPKEPLIDRFARETAIHWACQSGNDKCLYDTFAQVRLIGHHDRNAPKGLEDVIYCNGLRGDNKQNEWLWMWEKMKASNDERERNVIIKSLGCSEDKEALKSYLESSMGTNSDVNYSRAERLQVFSAVAASKVGVEVFVEFLEANKDEGSVLK